MVHSCLGNCLPTLLAGPEAQTHWPEYRAGWVLFQNRPGTGLDLLLWQWPQQGARANLPQPRACPCQGETCLAHHYPTAALLRWSHSGNVGQLSSWPQVWTHQMVHWPGTGTGHLTKLGAVQLSRLIILAPTRFTQCQRETTPWRRRWKPWQCCHLSCPDCQRFRWQCCHQITLDWPRLSLPGNLHILNTLT